MIWELDKKVKAFSNNAISILTLFWDAITKEILSYICMSSPLFWIVTTLPAFYHLCCFNIIGFIVTFINFLLLISFYQHFKYQSIGIKNNLLHTGAVNVKVGRKKFEISEKFCKKYGTFFDRLKNSGMDKNGYIILDRDETNFEKFLGYLEDRKLKLPTDIKSLKEICHEAEHFGIGDLVQKCKLYNWVGASKDVKIKVGNNDFQIELGVCRKHKAFYNYLKDCKVDEYGRFIIQRDGTHFGKIKEFMENGSINTIDVITMKDIAYEASFYGLTDLANLCDVQKHLLSSKFIKIKIGNSAYNLDAAICRRYPTFHNQLRNCKVDDDGYFILQRDETHFDKIRKYMYTEKIDFTTNVTIIRDMCSEARYYGITGLVNECNAFLQKDSETAAAFSRSVFNKQERDTVAKTGAACVFLEFGFLGKNDLKFTDDVAYKHIAKGLIDFMKVRNDDVFDDFFLIMDFTLPQNESDYKIALNLYFGGACLDTIEIYNHNNPARIDKTLQDKITYGCLQLSKLMRRSENIAKEGSRQLSIK